MVSNLSSQFGGYSERSLDRGRTGARYAHARSIQHCHLANRLDLRLGAAFPADPVAEMAHDSGLCW